MMSFWHQIDVAIRSFYPNCNTIQARKTDVIKGDAVWVRLHTIPRSVSCIFRGLKKCRQIERCKISNDDLHISGNAEGEKVSIYGKMSTNRMSTYRTMGCKYIPSQLTYTRTNRTRGTGIRATLFLIS